MPPCSPAKRAVEGLAITPLEALVDGNAARRFDSGTGDRQGRCTPEPAISAASILATDYQGRADAFARPSFAIWFAAHKGYPTAAHLAARNADRQHCAGETYLSESLADG